MVLCSPRGYCTYKIHFFVIYAVTARNYPGYGPCSFSVSFMKQLYVMIPLLVSMTFPPQWYCEFPVWCGYCLHGHLYEMEKKIKYYLGPISPQPLRLAFFFFSFCMKSFTSSCLIPIILSRNTSKLTACSIMLASVSVDRGVVLYT